jgi:WD40 repeat protein
VSTFAGAVRVYDVATGELRLGPSGPVSWVDRLSLSADGRTLATGGWDGIVRIWDLATGTLRASERVTSAIAQWGSVQLSPRGDRVLVAPAAGRCSVIPIESFHEGGSTESGTAIGMPEDRRPDAAFSPDGRQILLVTRDGTLGLWQIDDSSTMARFMVHGWGYFSCAFVGHDRAVVGAENGEVSVLDVRPGSTGIVRKIGVAPFATKLRQPNLALNSIGAGSDGLRCVAQVIGGQCVFFDAVLGAGAEAHVVGSESSQSAWLHGVAASPGKDSCAASISEDGSLCLWDMRTGLAAGFYQMPELADDGLASVAFVPPDGRTLLIGLYSGLVLELERRP